MSWTPFTRKSTGRSETGSDRQTPRDYGNGKTFEEYPLGQRYTKSQAEKETKAVDRLLQKVVREVGPRGLSKTLRWRGRRPFRISVRNMLLHMVEEELQHRGEMNALLWQIDVDPPVTGFGED
jgi:uncharacterized damage-inducible protein DinB